MTQNEVTVYGATLFYVGLSQVIKVPAGDHVIDGTLKIQSGGGTLEIVNPVYSGSSTQAGLTAPAWGNGYPVSASEILSFYGPAIFYLAATGATMQVAMTVGRTAGATVI